MKAKKIIVILAGLMLLMTQISYGDTAVDRLLKEARKRQAQEQKQQGTVEEVTTEEAAPVTESGLFLSSCNIYIFLFSISSFQSQ